MSKITYQLGLVYFIGIFFLYPVLAHIIMYQLGYLVGKLPHGKIWTNIQVFISGPVLIIVGLLLYFKYGGTTHKIFGALFLIVACYWLYNIAREVANEAA